MWKLNWALATVLKREIEERGYTGGLRRVQEYLQKGSGANRLIGPVKVAIQSIWWAAMSKRKGLKGLFDGRHFGREIIVLCMRWYLRYKLSLRDLVEMMAERGLSLAHTTIMRWVKRFTPEFVKRWNRFGILTGRHGVLTRPI